MPIKGNRTLKRAHRISTPIWVYMWNSIGYTGLQLLHRANWTLARHLIPGKYNSSLSRRAWMRLMTTIFDLSLSPGVRDIITSSEATERCLIGVSQINNSITKEFACGAVITSISAVFLQWWSMASSIHSGIQQTFNSKTSDFFQ